jgi:DUF1680 family protein
VNFYAASEGEAQIAGTAVKLTQTTDYPWSGAINLTLAPTAPVKFTLKVRIPGWALGRPVPSDLYAYREPSVADWKLTVNGAPATGTIDAHGYVAIERRWQAGDRIGLDFPMSVHAVVANEKVADARGQVAFERGPVVYCFEQADQPIPASVSRESKIVTREQSGALGKITALDIDGAIAIPYFAWNNRGLAPMAVWRPVK